MEPVGLELEQTTFLPPHDLVTYAKDQSPYRPLPVARLHGAEGRLISRWTFTPEERAQIAAGEDLYLEVLTFPGQHLCPHCGQGCHVSGALQPLLPTVGLRDFCPMDPVG